MPAQPSAARSAYTLAVFRFEAAGERSGVFEPTAREFRARDQLGGAGIRTLIIANIFIAEYKQFLS